MVSVKELRQYLDSLGIKYSKKDKKTQLLDLFPRGRKEKEKPIEVFIPKGKRKVVFKEEQSEERIKPSPPKRSKSVGDIPKANLKVPELKDTLRQRGFKGNDLLKKKAELKTMVDTQLRPTPKKEAPKEAPKDTPKDTPFQQAKKKAEQQRKEVVEQQKKKAIRRPSVIDLLKDKAKKAEEDSKELEDRLKKEKKEKALKLITSLQTQARGKKARTQLKDLKNTEQKEKAFEDLAKIAEKAKTNSQAKREYERLIEAQKRMTEKDRNDLRRKSEVDFTEILKAEKVEKNRNNKKRKEIRRQTREELKARQEFQKIKLATDEEQIKQDEKLRREEKLKKEQDELARREQKRKTSFQKSQASKDLKKIGELAKSREKAKRDEEMVKQEKEKREEREKIQKIRGLENFREKATKYEEMVKQEQEKREEREKARKKKAEEKKAAKEAALAKERDDIQLALAIAREKTREKNEARELKKVALAKEAEERQQLDADAREKALGVSKTNFIKKKIESFSPPSRLLRRVKKKEETEAEMKLAKEQLRKSRETIRENELRSLGFLPAEEVDLLQVFNDNYLLQPALNEALDKTEVKDLVEEAKKQEGVIQPALIARKLSNYEELQNTLETKVLDKALRGYISHLKGKLPKKSDLNLYTLPTISPIKKEVSSSSLL